MSQSALAKAEPQALSPIAAAVNRYPRDRYNVLAPIVHMDRLPMATRIAVTEIRVNPDPKGKEVFPIAGSDLLLSKVVLDRIAAAAGISWLEERRVDDGRHPHLCQMFVRGKITDFDGTVREITGSKLVDLREDAGEQTPGKDYEEIASKAKKGNRDPSGQLMEARKFIAEVASSKARNRAIASALGIKRAYSREELQRPFIVPKLVLDTQHAAAQQAVLANMTGAAAALFGQPVAAPERLIDAPVEEDAPVPTVASGGPVVDAQLDDSDQIAIVKEAWAKAKGGGMEPATFKQLCSTNTGGKTRKEDMTAEEARAVARAVEAYLAQRQEREPGDDDDLPV